VRQIKERIKNIRKGRVRGKTIGECEAELTKLRETSECIWEAKKARAFWWASLLHFLNELGLLNQITPPTLPALDFTTIVLGMGNNPLLIAETRSERISDAIKRFNKAWIGNGLRPLSKYAKAIELDKAVAQVWRRLARRLRALKRAGNTTRELNGEAVIPRPPSSALQAKTDVRRWHPVAGLQRLLEVRVDRALRERRMLPLWGAMAKDAREKLSEHQRAALMCRLSVERTKVPEPIDPRTVYEALRRDEQGARRLRDDTNDMLRAELAFGNTITDARPSDYEMRASSLDHAVDRDKIEAAWTKWTTESSAWNDDVKAEAQKAATERREWAELLDTPGHVSKPRTKTPMTARLAA
jgi:hypothetical protein